jgi:glycosyltransferase involved in cell wall biosynthesis
MRKLQRFTWCRYMASRQEGLAIVIPQAIACALPVLATEHTGARDLIEDGVQGRIIPTDAIDSLKPGLREFLGDPVPCRSIGQRGRERVEARFTWTSYGDRITIIYSKALSDSRSELQQKHPFKRLVITIGTHHTTSS